MLGPSVSEYQILEDGFIGRWRAIRQKRNHLPGCKGDPVSPVSGEEAPILVDFMMKRNVHFDPGYSGAAYLFAEFESVV